MIAGVEVGPDPEGFEALEETAQEGGVDAADERRRPLRQRVERAVQQPDLTAQGLGFEAGGGEGFDGERQAAFRAEPPEGPFLPERRAP